MEPVVCTTLDESTAESAAEVQESGVGVVEPEEQEHLPNPLDIAAHLRRQPGRLREVADRADLDLRFIQRVEPRAIGKGIIELGGGRTTMEDPVDPAVGFVITAKPGDWVEAGEPVASVYARDRAGVERGRAALRKAITIGDEAEPPLPLISHRVTKAGVEPLA